MLDPNFYRLGRVRSDWVKWVGPHLLQLMQVGSLIDTTDLMGLTMMDYAQINSLIYHHRSLVPIALGWGQLHESCLFISICNGPNLG